MSTPQHRINQFAGTPIQLINSWVDDLHYKINPASSGDVMGELHVEQMLLPQHIDGRWLSKLTVTWGAKDPDKPAAFTIKISVYGFFCFAEGTPDYVKTLQMQFSAPSMLYAIARETIVGLTIRSPKFGALTLPPVAFMPDQANAQPALPSSATDSAVEAPAKKARSKAVKSPKKKT